MLRQLVEQWRPTGAWNTLCHALVLHYPHDDHQMQRKNESGVELSGKDCIAQARIEPLGVHTPDISRTPSMGEASDPTLPSLAPTPPRILAVVKPLRTIFDGVGTARTDRRMCNIVFPIAALRLRTHMSRKAME